MTLTDAESRDAYACAKSAMAGAYSRSGVDAARQFTAWTNYATSPYVSGTHGGRYVNNYANLAGSTYARYEDAGTMRKGTVLAKDSFSVNGKGKVVIGPLFLMAKMGSGFNTGTLDWQYQMVMPDGAVFGTPPMVRVRPGCSSAPTVTTRWPTRTGFGSCPRSTGAKSAPLERRPPARAGSDWPAARHTRRPRGTVPLDLSLSA